MLSALAVFAFGGNSGAAGRDGVAAVSSSACGPLQYGGKGDREALIVSDLPLQGDSTRALDADERRDRPRARRRQDWQAGGVKVAFQACDDSIATTGVWTKASARPTPGPTPPTPSVLGVIGTYNSGCAEVDDPDPQPGPRRRRGDGLPRQHPRLPDPAEPELRQGRAREPLSRPARNYARVVPNDAYQGAGLASFAKRAGGRAAPTSSSPASDPTSLGQAKTFRGAARKLGIALVGFKAWNAEGRELHGA